MNIPESLIRLVLKIARKFEISKYNVLSIIETLDKGLLNYNTTLANDKMEINERKLSIFIINIIRIAEKYNKASSLLTKSQLNNTFSSFGISIKELNAEEFDAFKMIDFKIVEPEIADNIFKLIKDKLPFSDKEKDALFNLALDVLVLVYCWKSNLSESFNRKMGMNKTIDNNLWAASILFTALKFLNVDAQSAFDSVCPDPWFARDVNELSGIFFSLWKIKKDNNIC